MPKESVITREEHVACELINYIEAKPDHSFGLCWYLVNGGEDNSTYSRVERRGYELIHKARELLTEFGHHTRYVCSDFGPAATRINFAKAVLKLLISGRLYCKNGYWQLRSI